MAGPADDMDETARGAAGPWSGRALKRGRWTDVGEGSAAAPKRADKTLSVRLTAAELAEFDAQIATLGLKRSMALRIAVRRVAGFVEVDAATVEALRGVARQIGGVATNINQIAKAANRTRDPDFLAFMEERAALGRDLARIEGLVQRLLELGARRADGLARLEAAAAAAGPVRRAPRRARQEGGAA